MKHRQFSSREQQPRDEESCASAFLEWYNDRHGTDFQRPERAEYRFADLEGRVRWEFVVPSESAPHDWLAIEVKRLPTLVDLERKHNEWAQICHDVEGLLAGRVTGGFELHLPPDLAMRQQDKQTLGALLADLIERNAPNMRVGGPSLDLGPQMAEGAGQWPMADQEPENLLLTKVADGGSGVTLAGAMVHGDVPQRHREAFDCVFVPEKKDGRIQADRQLELAKAYGAKEAILLLDCDPGYQPALFCRLMCEVDPGLVSNVDSAYLVGHRGIRQIHPRSTGASA